MHNFSLVPSCLEFSISARMTSSFSFGFSGDDIEGGNGDTDMDLAEERDTAVPAQVLLEPRRHSLEELVRSRFSQYAL